MDNDRADRIERKLDEIHGLLKQLVHGERKIMSAIDDLTKQVQATTDAEAAAIQLINGIPALIAAAGVDPAKLQALQAQLAASATALGAAVVANTPAATVTP